MAEARAKEAPKALKGSVYQACRTRWTALLAVAGMRSFAHSLLEEGTAAELHEGDSLPLVQLLEEGALAEVPEVSRMPARA